MEDALLLQKLQKHETDKLLDVRFRRRLTFQLFLIGNF
jgi:hypothetical protein